MTLAKKNYTKGYIYFIKKEIEFMKKKWNKRNGDEQSCS